MSDGIKYPNGPYISKFNVKTAILVDGGFYRARAKILVGEKSPKDRADELERYCLDHLHNKYENRNIYRIFYYDCPPFEKRENVYHPLMKRSVNLGNSELGKWMNSFLEELKHRRKFALRLGKLSQNGLSYNLKPDITKKLLDGSISISDLSNNDFILNVIFNCVMAEVLSAEKGACEDAAVTVNAKSVGYRWSMVGSRSRIGHANSNPSFLND